LRGARVDAKSAAMIVETFAAGPLGCNCSIAFDPVSKEALVVDPGGDVDEILARLKKRGLTAKAIVHTHTHFDHVGGTAALQRETSAPARIHEADHFLYTILPIQTAMFGMAAPETCELDTWLRDDEEIVIGALRVHVLHTPGHTPGSCCFELRSSAPRESLASGGASAASSPGEEVVLFSGDTLFHGSVGRTDLWGGDHDALLRSIRGKLLELPETTRVVCGHGEGTTIAFEKRANPFLR
jgi:glyoxylase-like metal-dependent hydrolase (beta-lactamase superfamily II)